MAPCGCERENLTGVQMAQRTRAGRTRMECAACGRELAISGTLESAALFRRGAKLLTEEQTRASGPSAAEAERQRQRVLAGLRTDPAAPHELTEEQKRQRLLAGLPV